MKAQAIDHIVLNVRDVDLTARWYERVLGMTREEHRAAPDGPARVSLRFGRQKINVRPVAADQAEWFTARNPVVGSADLCLLVDARPDEVVAHLASENVSVELGPVMKRGALGSIRSVYCRDPDGSLIELSSYDAENRDAG